MFDETSKLKNRYSKQIEDGKKVEIFTSTPEWDWYVKSVINPTIEEYTERILTGKIPTDKEDWILRGMIIGMKMVIETTTGFKETAEEARKKAQALQKGLDNEL